MSRRKLPSARLLKRLLRYEPETGLLFWRARPVWMFPKHHTNGLRQTHAKIWNNRLAGKEAFTTLSYGYRTSPIFRVAHRAHRVIWCMSQGEWPNGQIDHINGDRADNRLANLRIASAAENARNAKLRKDNMSGCPGVHWHKADKRWKAHIGACSKYYLGSFERFEDAVAARKQAEKDHNYHSNHGRARS